MLSEKPVMTQATVRLRISFESLVEAIVSLEPEEKLQLRQLLDQKIVQLQATDPTLFLHERGCAFPVKIGLQQTSEPLSSGHTDVSVNHDQLIVQHSQAES